MRRLALLLAAALTGCGQQVYRAETVWHADGRVERAILQPRESLPEAVRGDWETVRSIADVASTAVPVDADGRPLPAAIDGRTAPIRSLPADGGDQSAYLAAWNTFAGPNAMPDHLRIVAADPAKAGTLERSVVVHNYGLVKEYVWSETLTDVVSLDDMEAALRETADLVADLAAATLADSDLADTDLDATALIAWLRGDAADWFAESHAALVEAALRRQSEAERLAWLTERLTRIAQWHGFEATGPNGMPLSNKAWGEATGRFLTTKVCDTVRTADGGRLAENQAQAVLRRLGFDPDGSSGWQASPEWTAAVLARFGSDEAASQRGREFITRLLGVYTAGYFAPRRPFRYEMTLPGQLVETTGTRIGGGRVRWTFDAADAFPLGYAMTARSLAADEAAQTQLLGAVRLRSLDRMTE